MVSVSIKRAWSYFSVVLGVLMVVSSSLALLTARLQSLLQSGSEPLVDTTLFGSPMFFGGLVLLAKERRIVFSWVMTTYPLFRAWLQKTVVRKIV